MYKVVSISPGDVLNGAGARFVTTVDFATKKFYALKVGEKGRGRTQRFIPLVNRLAPENPNQRDDLKKLEYIRLRKGNFGWIGEVEEQVEDVSGSLVLLNTAGGFRGYTAVPAVVGSAEVIETGWRAQGIAGRAGSHPELMILSTGPARIEWRRAGRLYGGHADWVAWSPDGKNWYCQPREEYLISLDIGLVPDAVIRLGQDNHA